MYSNLALKPCWQGPDYQVKEIPLDEYVAVIKELLQEEETSERMQALLEKVSGH